MIKINATVQGLRCTFDYKDYSYFKTLRYEISKGPGGVKRREVIDNVSRKISDDTCEIGLGGILWLHNRSPFISVNALNLTPRLPLINSIYIPHLMKSSPKWLVNGKERFYLYESIESCFNKPMGMVKLPTGSGKTEIELILAYNQFLEYGTGIILVPTISIKEQFIERAKKYRINVVKDYSQIRYDDYIEDCSIIVTTPGVFLNDISKNPKIAEDIHWLIGDECHHSGCNTWYDIFMNLPNAERCHGFSALPIDAVTGVAREYTGLSYEDAKVTAVMGGVIYEKSAKDLKFFLNTPYLINIDYNWIMTSELEDLADSKVWRTIQKLVNKNVDRINFISNIIKYLTIEKYKSISFVNEKNYGSNILREIKLTESIAWYGSDEVISNDDCNWNSIGIRESFGDSLLSIIATSHAIEGLDLNNPINCLVLHEGKKIRPTLQKVGRAIRPDVKPAIIVNLIDIGIDVLYNQSITRSNSIEIEFDCKVYNIQTLDQLAATIKEIEKDYDKDS